jgi:dipeptidyl aminopeptidase/acylaminoacyl peptidase
MRAGIRAEDAVAAAADFTELAATATGVVYGRFDPADAVTRLWHAPVAGNPRCLTPDGFSVRSRVYEYGGGSFCATDHQVAFVNEADQQVYVQPLDGGTPHRLTGQDGGRYGGLAYDAAHGRILAVEETAQAQGLPQHRLVAIDLHGGRTVMHEGQDFYGAGCASPDGRSLVWISWQRPAQPWTQTRLMRLPCDAHGMPSGPAEVLREGSALQQPGFDAGQRLVVIDDADGWWRPWVEATPGTFQLAPSHTADHAGAPWQLATHTWAPLRRGGMLATWLEGGMGQLGILSDDGVHVVPSPYTRWRSMVASHDGAYAIAASPTQPPCVVHIRTDGHVDVVAGSTAFIPDGQVILPEPIRWPTRQGEAHGFLYLPHDQDTPPPLLVFAHGGPTSAAQPVFDARIQFWCSHGFAVADVDYRGSTGYGRAYREALHLQWGVADVDDVCSVVDWLGTHGRVDGRRAFIRGSSAGGYTVLCALAFRRTFQGGASLYGVSDPAALAKDTHKFEADYLDWLIGDVEADADRYAQRTPLRHADDIAVPVIFFQGLLDAVVVPAQTEAMVAALQRRGVTCEYHAYPDERHGFRQARNLAHALRHELAFYRQVLSAWPDGAASEAR